ncbi:MAG TPA: alpha/beta hydrolase [Ktedonobacterales bacterium]
MHPFSPSTADVTTDVPPRPQPPVSPGQRTGKPRRGWRGWLIALLVVSGLLTSSYAATSVYMATQVVDLTGRPLNSQTPAEFGLAYRDVGFLSREDQVSIRGWFIPGVLANGHLTTDRTLIVLHGWRANRQDMNMKLMDLERDLARHGFAVLAFDMRNGGQSAKAIDGLGSLEYRDVLGAVDFLRQGALPFPNLGRPRVIAGWGVSEGGTAMINAMAREPAIQALVLDSTIADWLPMVEREYPIRGAERFPLLGPLMPGLLPGAFTAEALIYGVNQYANRPVDVVASLAPRPLFFIHADHDDFVPSSMMDQLVAAASAPANAHVQSWKVPNVYTHDQAYATYPDEYVAKVTAFYTASLGPDQSGGA